MHADRREALGGRSFEADIEQLSSRRGALRTDETLAPHDEIRIAFAGEHGDAYAKVQSVGDGLVVVRFTAMPPAIAALAAEG